MPLYHCKFNVTTNKGFNRTVYLRQDAIDAPNARIIILHRVLMLTKYGYPRIYFESRGKDQLPSIIFAQSNDSSIHSKEYVEIDFKVFSILTSIKLEEVVIDTIKKKGLNHNAPPFIPSKTW